MDNNDYFPVSFEQLKKIMANLPQVHVAGHEWEGNF